jgi:hypothetical protein
MKGGIRIAGQMIRFDTDKPIVEILIPTLNRVGPAGDVVYRGKDGTTCLSLHAQALS